MVFFISFFMSPLALVLYGVLGVVLLHSFARKGSGYGGFSKYDLAILLQIAIVVSAIALIVCQVHDPYGYRSINKHILGHFGSYFFGLTFLLSVWGFKRADKVEEPLFENFEYEDEPSKGPSPQFKKFAFFVYITVSLVGFCVSVNYGNRKEQQATLIKNYKCELRTEVNKMEEAIKYPKTLTREKLNVFSNTLSAIKDKYEKEIEDDNHMWDVADLQKKYEKLLVKYEKLLVEIEERVERIENINDECKAELERFLSILPDKLTEEQWGEYNVTLFNLYKTYYKSLTRYNDNEEFSVEVEQLYQHCKQELNNRM